MKARRVRNRIEIDWAEFLPEVSLAYRGDWLFEDAKTIAENLRTAAAAIDAAIHDTALRLGISPWTEASQIPVDMESANW